MLPVDIATRDTLASFEQNIAPNRCRLLEVGCGSGYLAKAFEEAGADVTALYTSHEAVADACAMGVRAVVCDFLDYERQSRRG